MREWIALHAIGSLEGDEAALVEAALAADPQLAQEFAELRETVHSVAAWAPQVELAPHGEARLMASVGAGQYDRFAAQISRLYDFSLERAREVLGCIEAPAAWERLVANVDVIHFAAGPRCAGADCGAVRIRAGGVFPMHSHLGEEMSVIVAGVVRDSGGARHVPGSEILQQPGTSHELAVEGNGDVILFARAFNGIQLARVRQP